MPGLRAALRPWLPAPARRWLARLAGTPLVERWATELTYRFGKRRVARLVELERRLPRALYLEATNVCNAECVFCAYPLMERPKATMSMELFEDVLDQYEALGGRHVSLTPIVGDPLADARLFDRLDSIASRPAIASFHFFTNAILLDEGRRRRLLAYGPRLRVCVSLGGFDRETYAAIMGVDRFDRVWANLRGFVEESEALQAPARLEVHLRCARRDRAGDAWEELSSWRESGLVTVASIDSYDSWAGVIAREALEAHGLTPTPMPHKRGPCELLYMKPVVLADGRVNACACRDVEAELVVGDLAEESLRSIVEGPALEELRERHERGDYPEVCRRCTYYVSVFNPLKSRIGADDLNWDREAAAP